MTPLGTKPALPPRYNPLHPSVLRLIQFTAESALRNRIPISICGEIAGDARFTALLLGLGIQELSMSAHALGPVKQRVREIELAAAQNRAHIIMSQTDPGRIAALVANQDQAAGLRVELDEAVTARDKLAEQRRRLALAYAEGMMELEVYGELSEDVGGRLRVAQDRVDELHRLIEAMPDAEQRAEALGELSVSFRDLLRDNDPQRVSTLLQNAGVWLRVEREGDERVIEIGIG